MSGRRDVVWSPEALADVDEIIARIQRDAPTAAASWIERFEAAGQSLETMTTRGKVVPELADQGITTLRQLVLASWRVIYRVDAKAVSILAVVDSRRQILDLLMDRLTRL